MSEADGKDRAVPMGRRAILASAVAGAAVGVGAAKAASKATDGTAGAPAEAPLSIVQFGASVDNADNSRAVEAAVATASKAGRSVHIPEGVFNVSRIDLVANDATEPVRFSISGPGTLRSTISGTVFVASGGQFYDLVLDGVRFESRAGAGTCLVDGDAFHRLILTPGTQVEAFDWLIRAKQHLQSVRMIGVIVRGGSRAVVQAPMAYDCTFAHNIIEFVTDGIVIDGPGDPAVHTCRIEDNVIEGVGGRAIVLGSCLATTIAGNYLEGNQGADIRLDAGKAPHKGLAVRGNSIQLAPARLRAGAYGIVWGQSTALPVRAGGNFCTGHLHDTRGVTALIDMTGDFAQGQLYTGFAPATKAGRSPTGRALYTDGLGLQLAWFDRYLSLDPHAGELAFGGHFDSSVGETQEPLTLSYGTAAPSAAPASFDRKRWARGSVVINARPTAEGVFAWICVEAGAPGVWEVVMAGR